MKPPLVRGALVVPLILFACASGSNSNSAIEDGGSGGSAVGWDASSGGSSAGGVGAGGFGSSGSGSGGSGSGGTGSGGTGSGAGGLVPPSGVGLGNHKVDYESAASANRERGGLCEKGLGVPVPPPIAGERLGPPKYSPWGEDYGSFRLGCSASHYLCDDPLNKPAEAGKAGLQVYYGNGAINAYSRVDPRDPKVYSLENTGGSTCPGGALNQSAYWGSAMLDAQGNIVPSFNGYIYYKGSSTTVVAPPGLAMIVGDPERTPDGGKDFPGRVDYTCSDDIKQHTVPDCAPETEMGANLWFPSCWNGKDLWDPEMKHMSDYAPYGSGLANGCPASHAVRIPEIAIRMQYRVPAGGMNGWFLATDAYRFTENSNGTLNIDTSKPRGLSLSGGFVYGWQEKYMEELTAECINAHKNCGVDHTPSQSYRSYWDLYGWGEETNEDWYSEWDKPGWTPTANNLWKPRNGNYPSYLAPCTPDHSPLVDPIIEPDCK